MRRHVLLALHCDQHNNDERVIGILTTGFKPLFLQCDNKLQMHRKKRLQSLTALHIYARAKDIEPM